MQETSGFTDFAVIYYEICYTDIYDVLITVIKEIELSNEEREFLANYRKLNLKQKRFVKKLLHNTRNKTDFEKEQILTKF